LKVKNATQNLMNFISFGYHSRSKTDVQNEYFGQNLVGILQGLDVKRQLLVKFPLDFDRTFGDYRIFPKILANFS
jgi:hypothetical protein